MSAFGQKRTLTQCLKTTKIGRSLTYLRAHIRIARY